MNDYKFKDKEMDSGVLRYSDGARIPSSNTNRDWQKYLDYVAVGGQTDPYMSFEELKVSFQNNAKQNCQSHIHSFYSAPIQQSMSFGIYPSETKDIMVSFIADCVEKENVFNGEYEACNTEDELKVVFDSIVWPLPGV